MSQQVIIIIISLAITDFFIEYNKLSFQSTYIPGTYNSRNVLFGWLRWQW
ncbi:hypothetical protein [Xenorhabdus bovienii]|nr:hypothetical protein [Xenorhabdus bovienii]